MRNHSTTRLMRYTTQFISKTLARLLYGLALVAVVGGLVGCSSALIEPERIEIKDPGPKSKVIKGEFLDVWKATLITLGKYPLKAYDEETGVIETDFIKGKEAWIAPHKKQYVPGGYRYRLQVRVFKGRKGSGLTKVVIRKHQEDQKDFFSNPKKIETDGLEELALLYRIEREVALEKALSNVERD